MTQAADLPPVEVTYTLADLYGALLYGWRRFVRILIIVELLWITLSVGVDLLNGATAARAFSAPNWTILGIGGVLLAAFWFGLCPLLGYFRIKRAGLLGPNRLTLSERGVRLESPKSESLIYWAAIRRMTLTASRLYLYLITYGTIIVPRRCFADESAFGAWAATARREWERAQP